MINFCRITNESAINSYLIKDDLYKTIVGVDQIKDININNQTEALLVATKNHKEIGLVLLQDLQNGYVNFHAGLFKEFRHQNALNILKQAIKTIKRLVFPLHLVTTVPEDNIPVWTLVDRAGFKFKKTIHFKNKLHKLYVE